MMKNKWVVSTSYLSITSKHNDPTAMQLLW